MHPGNFPNQNCNTWCADENELNKHLKFHCHLSEEEKKFPQPPDDNLAISRKLTKNIGLPANTITLANGEVKYNAEIKIRECTICQKTCFKYNRRQINHVNANRTARKSSFRTNFPRGTHVAKKNDRILQMEQDYGRIRLVGEFNEEINDFGETYKCLICNQSRNPKKQE